MVQKNDIVKNIILKDRDWNVFHIIDDIQNNRHYLQNVKLECRKIIKQIKRIIPITLANNYLEL